MAVAKTSKTMLKSSGESGHPCPGPDFRGNAFNFSPLGECLLWVYHIWLLFCWDMFLVCLLPGGVLFLNGCWILSKAFSASMEIIIWFLSFNLLMWCITLIDLWILKNPCIPGIKPTCSWCMIFLICCLILIAKILLRIFASLFISDIGLWFSILVAYLSGFGIRVMVAS